MHARTDGQRAPVLDAKVALRCLVHPTSLAALALLGLNDHFLKAAVPGVVTGKLSDFAGLYYVPFLAVVLLAPLGWLARRRPSAAPVFWGLAIWFTCAKTLSSVHAATVALASALVGDVLVVRDPTDIVAIVMLVPAWRMYRYQSSLGVRPLRKTLSPVVLCATVVLTAATSKPQKASVERLVADHSGLYAMVEYLPAGRQQRIYRTVDGLEWMEWTPPKHVRDRFASWKPNVPEALGMRRVNGSRGDWEPSQERQKFMRAIGADDDWGRRDIAFPGRHYGFVVALGTEGVLVEHEGRWIRRAVGDAKPTPMQTDFAEAWRLWHSEHWSHAFAAALLTFALLTLLAWRRRRPRNIERDLPLAKATVFRAGLSVRERLGIAQRGIRNLFPSLYRSRGLESLLVLALPVALLFLHLELGGPSHRRLLVPLLILAPMPVFFGWLRAGVPYRSRGEGPFILLPSLAVGLFTGGLFVLWSMGTIASHGWVMLGSVLAILCMFGLQVVQGAREPESDHEPL